MYFCWLSSWSESLSGLYDHATHKFSYPRDVIFYEHIFPFHTHPQEQEHDTVVLPLSHIPDKPNSINPSNPQADDLSLPPSALSPSLLPALNDPIPYRDPTEQPPLPTARRSARLKQPNVKLRNFHLYYTALVAPSQSSSSSGTLHSLPRDISYAQLSPKYRNFVCTITTVVEPVTYEQAALDPKW